MNHTAIKKHVQNHYECLFEGKKRCHLPVEKGKDLAGTLGYPADFLEMIPQEYWDHFVPCGNPLPYLIPASGDRILNLGCGVGIDSLGVFFKHGHQVEVVNADIVFTVLKQARQLASQLSIPKGVFQWICGDGEQLPFQSNLFDWIVMNGVFNLFPNKASLLKEIYRALRPSGQLVSVDLCCVDALPEYFFQEPDAWAWCMSGACTEDELMKLLEERGFEQIRLDRQEEGDWFHRVAFSCRKGPV
jgi:SAM-dependent methyltransferase